MLQSLQKPGASSCSETNLLRVLRKYNSNLSEEWVHIETLAIETIFETTNGKKFIKGAKLRKRFMCVEQSTGLKYLFSPLCEVKRVDVNA